MLTAQELWNKAGTNQHITRQDIGQPQWKSECVDGIEYELRNFNCRSGFAYNHKNGFRWSNGDFLTEKERLIYGV